MVNKHLLNVDVLAKDFLELSRLRQNFFDKIDRINKIFLYSLYPEHPVYPV